MLHVDVVDIVESRRNGPQPSMRHDDDDDDDAPPRTALEELTTLPQTDLLIGGGGQGPLPHSSPHSSREGTHQRRAQVLTRLGSSILEWVSLPVGGHKLKWGTHTGRVLKVSVKLAVSSKSSGRRCKRATAKNSPGPSIVKQTAVAGAEMA